MVVEILLFTWQYYRGLDLLPRDVLIWGVIVGSIAFTLVVFLKHNDKKNAALLFCLHFCPNCGTSGLSDPRSVGFIMFSRVFAIITVLLPLQSFYLMYRSLLFSFVHFCCLYYYYYYYHCYYYPYHHFFGVWLQYFL